MFIAVLVICIAALTYVLYRKNRGMPPGPGGLSWITYADQMIYDYDDATLLTKLHRKYGPVISVPHVFKRWIVIGSHEAAREALVKNPNVFSGTRHEAFLEYVNARKGIFQKQYGPEWIRLKKFTAATMVGIGGRRPEECVMAEADRFCKILASKEGLTLDFGEDLLQAMSSIVLSMFSERKLPNQEEQLRRLLQVGRRPYTEPLMLTGSGIVRYLPSLRHLPWLKSCFAFYTDRLQILKDLYGGEIDRRQAVRDFVQPRDLIGGFLLEMESAGSEEPFTRDQLDIILLDLFIAGNSTITLTLKWCLYYLAKYPDFQDKLAEEIKAALGKDATPTMEHKPKMHLVCSFIHEMQRNRSVVGKATRLTLSDVVFRGYKIPKGTRVIINLDAINKDPDVFEDAEELRPDRFLNDKGEFSEHDCVTPFMLGPRQCLGMTLAHAEMFIFLTTIANRFRIVEDPRSPIPPFYSGKRTDIFWSPNPFKVKFLRR